MVSLKALAKALAKSHGAPEWCAPASDGSVHVFDLRSAWTTQHRKNGRRRADLDCCDNFKAVSLIKGRILLVRRPEICSPVFPVAAIEGVLEECRSTPLVSMQRVNTDQRQVPVRLRRPMMLGHLEDRADISLQISSHAVCDDRFNKCSVAVHSRGKPN